jgi:pimeloyl-ACP methyl ester carboxylesterase
MHLLEAGFDGSGRPCVILLHGFPELAHSWRKQRLPLAHAGFHVVALNLRGYGRSGGTEVSFDDDLSPFTVLNPVSDTLGLVHALGYRNMAAVVGRDYDSSIAAVWVSRARCLSVSGAVEFPLWRSAAVTLEHGPMNSARSRHQLAKASSKSSLCWRSRANTIKSIMRPVRPSRSHQVA